MALACRLRLQNHLSRPHELGNRLNPVARSGNMYLVQPPLKCLITHYGMNNSHKPEVWSTIPKQSVTARQAAENIKLRKMKPQSTGQA